MCVCLHMYIMYILFSVAQSCLTLCNPVDCGPPGSSVHGTFPARILEWVAISFSRGSSRPRDQTQVSCLAGRVFTTEPPSKPYIYTINIYVCVYALYMGFLGGSGGKVSTCNGRRPGFSPWVGKIP